MAYDKDAPKPNKYGVTMLHEKEAYEKKKKKKKTQSMTRTTNPNKGKGSIWAQTKAAMSKRKQYMDEI